MRASPRILAAGPVSAQFRRLVENPADRLACLAPQGSGRWAEACDPGVHLLRTCGVKIPVSSRPGHNLGGGDCFLGIGGVQFIGVGGEEAVQGRLDQRESAGLAAFQNSVGRGVVVEAARPPCRHPRSDAFEQHGADIALGEGGNDRHDQFARHLGPFGQNQRGRQRRAGRYSGRNTLGPRQSA